MAEASTDAPDIGDDLVGADALASVDGRDSADGPYRRADSMAAGLTAEATSMATRVVAASTGATASTAAVVEGFTVAADAGKSRH
jgi:hypothetical protein